jgi:hypothetical protein
VTVVEAVGVDDPPGDVTMFDEAVGDLGRLKSFLHARALASWTTPSKHAIVLDVEVKLNVLEDYGVVNT